MSRVQCLHLLSNSKYAVDKNLFLSSCSKSRFFTKSHGVIANTVDHWHFCHHCSWWPIQGSGCQPFAHWEREATIITKGDTLWQQASCSTEDCDLRGRKLWMKCKSSFKNAFLTLTGLLLPFLDLSPPPQAPQVAQNPPGAQDDALPATPPAASDSDHSEYEPSRPMITPTLSTPHASPTPTPHSPIVITSDSRWSKFSCWVPAECK